jgi:hypothetical protein
MTSVIWALPAIVLELRMGRSVMKRARTAVLFLLAIGACAGCNRGKDEVLPNGNKLFGHRRLKDGTEKVARVEGSFGVKTFEVIRLADGTEEAERVELPDGEKQFEIAHLPDGTIKIGRAEFSYGMKVFDVTFRPDGTERIARIELPDGEKRLDVVDDGLTEKIARDELPDGAKRTDVTVDVDPRAAYTVFPNNRVFPYEPPKPTFSNVQNDQQGYAGANWGAGIADLDPTAAQQTARCFEDADREENESIAAVFGVPSRDTVVAGTVVSTSLDFSVVPAKCKSVTKGDVRLIFYDDKLTMAFTHLDAHNYDAIASNIASKFAEADGWTVNWGGGAADDGDSTSVDVRLFKRGDTNTRAFLIKHVSHMGVGMNVSSLYLLYVPNSYYENVRADIAMLKREQQAQQLAERNKREQPDLQKIQ